MFAVDDNYKHVLFSPNDKFTLSDCIFSNIIPKIYNFTEEICRANKIILYAVPQAENYIRNRFTRFENFMLQSESKFLDGYIIMYIDL